MPEENPENPSTPPPVVVNTPPPSNQLTETLTQIGNQLAALPETLVKSLRESTPADPPPAQTTATPSVEQQTTTDVDDRKRLSGFHGWWFGKGAR